MKGNDVIFNSVDALYYNFNKIRLSRGGSYIDTSKWLKEKKTTINPNKNSDKSFQYTLTIGLNYEQILKIVKEYRKLSLLLINTIRKK